MRLLPIEIYYRRDDHWLFDEEAHIVKESCRQITVLILRISGKFKDGKGEDTNMSHIFYSSSMIPIYFS